MFQQNSAHFRLVRLSFTQERGGFELGLEKMVGLQLSCVSKKEEGVFQQNLVKNT